MAITNLFVQIFELKKYKIMSDMDKPKKVRQNDSTKRNQKISNDFDLSTMIHSVVKTILAMETAF